MNNLRHFTFICEFRIKLGDSLNSNHVAQFNTVKDSESVNAGQYSLGECDIDKDTLTGRYYLKAEIIPESDSDYMQTMRTDLVLLIKRDLNFPMDGIPEIEFSGVLQSVIIPVLELRHSNGDKKMYYHSPTNMFYILNDDSYCDGSYFSEEEAVNALANNEY